MRTWLNWLNNKAKMNLSMIRKLLLIGERVFFLFSTAEAAILVSWDEHELGRVSISFQSLFALSFYCDGGRGEEV